jgi:hypothetical protein
MVPGGGAMTEAEWLACEEPRHMLEFLPGRTSDRKLRLFAVACCRRIWHLMPDEQSRTAVEVAERYADGLALPHEREAASVAAGNSAMRFDPGYDPDEVPDYEGHVSEFAAHAACHTAAEERAPSYSAYAVTDSTVKVVGFHRLLDTRPLPLEHELNQNPIFADATRAELIVQCELLRCIAGPSVFRPVTINPAWQPSTVIALAQAIYDDLAFDRMPILADALEDAGCTNQDILAHCRSGGEHVRGCWVVDLLLGKT